MSNEQFIQGNIACSLGAIKAGCRFFGGYPITPSTEIAESMASLLPTVGGSFIQMEDEISALGSVIGASWGGLKSMTATSGPGFSLMQEHIGYAQMTETPLVIVDVQRGSPSTAQPTMASQSDVMQARWGSHGDYETIAFAPSSVQEFFDFTIETFNYAEKYRIPAIVLADEIIGHMREKIIIPDEIKLFNRKRPNEDPSEFLPYKSPENSTPPMPPFGEGYNIHVTGLTHNEKGYPDTSEPEVHAKLVERLCNKILKNKDDIISIKKENCDDADLVLIAYGAPVRSISFAVKKAREEGLKVGFIKLDTIWPFPDKEILEIAQGTKDILVAEMNLGQIFYEVQRASNGEANVHLLSKIGGEMQKPEEVIHKIKEILN